MENVLLLIFLLFYTITDLAFMKIPPEPIPLMVIAGCLLRWHAHTLTWQGLLLSFLPGLLLLLPVAAQKHWIGAGDGLVFLGYGAFAGIEKTLEALFLSSVFAAVWALFLLFYKKQEEEVFPFIPFVFAAELVLRTRA